MIQIERSLLKMGKDKNRHQQLIQIAKSALIVAAARPTETNATHSGKPSAVALVALDSARCSLWPKRTDGFDQSENMFAPVNPLRSHATMMGKWQRSLKRCQPTRLN